MKTKEELKRIIHKLIEDYQKNEGIRGTVQNFYFMGFIRGMQYSISDSVIDSQNALPEWFLDVLIKIEKEIRGEG